MDDVMPGREFEDFEKESDEIGPLRQRVEIGPLRRELNFDR